MKLFTIAAFTLMFSYSSNAQTEVVIAPEGQESCFQEAWDFGSRWAGFLGLDSYYYTDLYYSDNCV